MKRPPPFSIDYVSTAIGAIGDGRSGTDGKFFPSLLPVGPENRLSGVAALGYVVRQVCDYDASEPSHPRTLAENVPSVPEFSESSKHPEGAPPAKSKFRLA